MTVGFPEDAGSVNPVGADGAATVQDVPVVQKEPHMDDAPFIVAEKGKIPETGFGERSLTSQFLLLRGVPWQCESLRLEYRLSEP